MDSRQLECFIALAEELNFRRAADRCLLTQPSMSQQLVRLEEQLEAKLVHRTKRKVQLTRAGQVFLAEARKIHDDMRQAKRLVQMTERGEMGHITVGATVPAIYIVLASIIGKFRELLPGVGIVVQEMDMLKQEEELRSHRIDVGIVHPPLDDKSLQCETIAQLAFDVVIHRENPLAERASLTMKDLENEPLVIFSRKLSPKLYDKMIELCQESGFTPKNIIEAAPAQAIIAHVASGLGVGFIASDLQKFNHPQVVYRELSKAKPYLTLGIAYNDRELSPVIRIFRDIAVEMGKTLK